MVEPSMFRRRNILEENVQTMISLEVEIRKSSTSRHLMHMSYEIFSLVTSILMQIRQIIFVVLLLEEGGKGNLKYVSFVSVILHENSNSPFRLGI